MENVLNESGKKIQRGIVYVKIANMCMPLYVPFSQIIMQTAHSMITAPSCVCVCVCVCWIFVHSVCVCVLAYVPKGSSGCASEQQPLLNYGILELRF